MVTYRKWHKAAGLTAGAILFLLAFTGFFLDHKNWSFLYTTTISNSLLPSSVYDNETRLFEAYWKDPRSDTAIVGGKRGIFIATDGKSFTKVLDRQCQSLRYDQKGNTLYAATDDGIYSTDSLTRWDSFMLKGSYVNALAMHDGKLLASVEKQGLVLIDMAGRAIMHNAPVRIAADELRHDVKLGRFVRDLHYGRGLFDDGWSLLINDAAAIVLTLLSVGGFLIWFFITKTRSKDQRYAPVLKTAIKLHSNVLAVLAIIPLVLLALTGILLDHSDFFGPFMKNTTVKHAVLPPVYDTLHEDIWSVDIDGESYRIGNRYGVYKSGDLERWELESPGLAYRMKRLEGTLLVSGMGSPNRIHTDENGWKVMPKTPHMYKDVWAQGEGFSFLSAHHPKVALPSFESATLYSLFVTLHDGTFFASWWVYVNDIASVLMFVLLYTGTARWLKGKNILRR